MTKAQTDSSSQIAIALDVKDLLPPPKDSLRQAIYSAARMSQFYDETPVMMYVVTKSEIERFGCRTLVDVMRLIPGMRTSQPGSAMEGETFLVHGLKGNQFMKILVNDIPVRPFVTAGMPIGYQLPIQQADRIEIVLGPQSTTYGIDAGAGVVNIILAESERPVYTSAALNFGQGGFRNSEVNFGGKLGKGKRIFRFNCYGGYTIFNNRIIQNSLSGDNVESNKAYDPEEIYTTLENYYNTSGAVVPQAHFSNHFGLDLNFRKFSFSYKEMYRKDVSFIGTNRTAIFHNTNYFGEKIQTFALQYRGNTSKKIYFNFDTGLNKLKVDGGSSITHLNGRFNQFMRKTVELDAPFDPNSALNENNFYLYLEGETPLDGYGTTFYSNAEVVHRPRKNLYIRAIFDAVMNPDDSEISNYGGSFKFDDRVQYFENNFFNFNGSLAANYTYKKLHINTAAGISLHDGYDIGQKLIYNTGVSYQLPRKFHFSANYSLGKNQLRLYYINNSIILDKNNQTTANLGINYSRLSKLDIIYNNIYSRDDLTVQDNTSFHSKHRYFDATLKGPIIHNYIFKLSYFDHYTNGLYQYVPFGDLKSKDKKENTIYNHFNGFLPSNRNFIHYQAIHLTQEGENTLILFKKRFPMKFSSTYVWTFGKESKRDFIREVPKSSFTSSLYLELSPKFSTSLFYLSSGSVIGSFYENTIESFGTLDVNFFYKFSKNLKSHLRIRNISNERSTGLSATNTSDDLFVSPQLGRNVQLGVIYNLN